MLERRIIQLPRFDLTVILRNFDFNFLLSLFLSLTAITFFRIAFGRLDVVVDNREATALVLEWIGDGVELGLNVSDFGLDLF